MSVSVSPTTTLTLSSTSAGSWPTSSLGASSSLFFNRSSRQPCFGLTMKARSRGNGKRRNMSCNSMFGLGVPELVVIGGVVALVFGPSKLPEVGRSFGKTIKSFQEAAKEFETELRKEPEPGAESSQENAIVEINQEPPKVVAITAEKQDIAL